MTKKVIWNTKSKTDQKADKANQIRKAQETQAMIASDWNRCLPLVKSLFAVKAQREVPIKVVRPISYLTQTYNGRNFQDSRATVPVGDTLLYKGIETGTSEMIFQDQNGVEHAIGIESIDRALMSTELFDIIKDHLDQEDQ